MDDIFKRMVYLGAWRAPKDAEDEQEQRAFACQCVDIVEAMACADYSTLADHLAAFAHSLAHADHDPHIQRVWRDNQ